MKENYYEYAFSKYSFIEGELRKAIDCLNGFAIVSNIISIKLFDYISV